MSKRPRFLAAVAAFSAAILLLAVRPALCGQAQGRVEVFYGQTAIRDAAFKTIYPGTPKIYGLAISARFLWNFEFYFSLKGLRQAGELSYTRAQTHLTIVPISYGLRFVLPSKWIQPYLGGGGEISVFLENNPIGTVWDYARGFHVLGGVFLSPSKTFPVQLGFQAKLSDVKANRGDLQIDLGGWEYGALLAFRF